MSFEHTADLDLGYYGATNVKPGEIPTREQLTNFYGNPKNEPKETFIWRIRRDEENWRRRHPSIWLLERARNGGERWVLIEKDEEAADESDEDESEDEEIEF